MRAVIIGLTLLVFLASVGAEPSGEAEATTKRFAEALARFDVIPMVEEFHSDVHQLCYTMAIHIVETTEAKTQRDELLKALGVANLAEFKKLTPKTATVKLFQVGFSTVSKPAREASAHSKIVIVGSLIEKDLVDVFYRSEADMKDLSMRVRVPSVVTLKREGGRWKVASTTQLESMMAKLASGSSNH
jgi:hypothetical protein